MTSISKKVGWTLLWAFWSFDHQNDYSFSAAAASHDSRGPPLRRETTCFGDVTATFLLSVSYTRTVDCVFVVLPLVVDVVVVVLCVLVSMFPSTSDVLRSSKRKDAHWVWWWWCVVGFLGGCVWWLRWPSGWIRGWWWWGVENWTGWMRWAFHGWCQIVYVQSFNFSLCRMIWY